MAGSNIDKLIELSEILRLYEDMPLIFNKEQTEKYVSEINKICYELQDLRDRILNFLITNCGDYSSNFLEKHCYDYDNFFDYFEDIGWINQPIEKYEILNKEYRSNNV